MTFGTEGATRAKARHQLCIFGRPVCQMQNENEEEQCEIRSERKATARSWRTLQVKMKVEDFTLEAMESYCLKPIETEHNSGL